MEDYKELIALLDGAMAMTASNGKIEKADLFCKAADAIEQLVKERDAAVDDLKKAMPCRACTHLAELEYCKNCYSENLWEWRGVQEV